MDNLQELEQYYKIQKLVVKRELTRIEVGERKFTLASEKLESYSTKFDLL
jgi:hypothetical protein